MGIVKHIGSILGIGEDKEQKAQIPNIFDMASSSFGAGFNAPAAVKPKAAVNIFEPIVPKTTTISTPKKGTKVTAPASEPGMSLKEKVFSPNVPVLGLTDTTRKQYSDIGAEEGFVQDVLIDAPTRGANQVIDFGAKGFFGPITRQLGNLGLVGDDTVKRGEKKVAQIDANIKKNIESKPFEQKDPKYNVGLGEAIKSGLIWDDPKYIGNIIGESVGQMIPMIPAMFGGQLVGGAAALLGAAPRIASVVGGTIGLGLGAYPQIVNQYYEDLVNNGIDKDKAAQASMVSAIVPSVFEAISDKLSLGLGKSGVGQKLTAPLRNKIIASIIPFLKTSGSEGVQEGTEQLVQNITARYFGIDRKVGEGVLDQIGFGAIGGSPFGIAGGISTFGDSIETVGMMDEAATQKGAKDEDTTKLPAIEKRLAEISKEDPATLPIQIKAEKLKLQQERDRLIGVQEAKFQTMDPWIIEEEKTGRSPKEPTVYEGPKQFTTKLLDELKGKTQISRKFIEDFMNRQDVKQGEKEIITEILQQYQGDKINVQDFGDRMEDRLFKITPEKGYDNYAGYGDSEKWFGENSDIDNAQYDEVVYRMPYQANPQSHYRSVPDYFGHVRQYDANRNGDPVRYIIEKQSDLTQGNKRENLTVELKQKADLGRQSKEINKVQSDIAYYNKKLKELESSGQDIVEVENRLKGNTIEGTGKEILNKRIKEAQDRVDLLTREMEDDKDINSYAQRRGQETKQTKLEKLRNRLKSMKETIKNIKAAIEKYYDGKPRSTKIQNIIKQSVLDLNPPVGNQTANDYLDSKGLENFVSRTLSNIVLTSRSFEELKKYENNLLSPEAIKLIEKFDDNLYDHRKYQLEQSENDLSNIQSDINFIESGQYDQMNTDIAANQGQGHKYILRQEIQRAINDGKKELYLPTGQSIPYYEGWIGNGGLDLSDNEFGDTIEIYGENYIYLGKDGYGFIRAVRAEEGVKSYDLEELLINEVDYQYGRLDDANNEDYNTVEEKIRDFYGSLDEFVEKNGGWDSMPSAKDGIYNDENQDKDGQQIALEAKFGDDLDTKVYDYIRDQIHEHFNGMSNSEREQYFEDQGYKTADVDGGKVVLSMDNEIESFDGREMEGIDPTEAKFEDSEFQDKVSNSAGDSALGTAKYYEYVLPNEIKDLARQYGYTRSKERDSNGLEHYVIDLDGIKDNWKDKPVPAFQRQTGRKAQLISPKEALAEVRKYFDADELPVSFVNKITTPEGLQAFGQYYKQMITFAANPDTTTPKHEVLHAYLDMFVDPSKKADIFREVRGLQAYKEYLGDRKHSDLLAEEFLADNFDAYVRESQLPKSLGQKIKQFFIDTVNNIKKLFGADSKMHQLYKNIIAKNRDFINEERIFEPKYMATIYDDLTEEEFNAMTKEEQDEVQKVTMMDQAKQDLDPERQSFVNRVAQIEYMEQRIGYIGKNRVYGEAKNKQRDEWYKKKERLIAEIAAYYNLDTNEAYEKYDQFVDTPIDQITRQPKKSTYVSVAEKAARVAAKVEKAKRTQPEPKKVLMSTKKVDQTKVSTTQTIGDRMKMVKDLQKQYGLSDGDMAREVQVDYTQIPQDKFDKYYNRLSARLAQIGKKKAAIKKVQKTVSSKGIKKEENLRQALGVNFNKATSEELEQYDQIIQMFQDGDTMLGKRMIETLENTDIAGTKSVKQMVAEISKKTGLSEQEITELYRMRAEAKKNGTAGKKIMDSKMAYQLASDSGLAKSTNPVVKLMVREFTIADLKAQQEKMAFEKEFIRLMKAARKAGSGGKGLMSSLAPEDIKVFDYLEAEGDAKQAIADTMTKEEYELANFLAAEFTKAREYLQERNQLKTRFADKYITHTMQTFLEQVKNRGLSVAIGDMFTKDKAEIDFGFAGETDQVLSLEKFFKFALARNGEITPSKNINRIVPNYFDSFYKKKALDQVLPKIAAYSYVLGDSNTNQFVKQWLNSKKGRQIQFLIPQGHRTEKTLMGFKSFVTFLDLAFNVPINVMSWVGAQGSNLTAGTTKQFLLGQKRSLTKKGSAIADKYSNIIGASPSDRRNLGGKTPLQKFQSIGMYVMQESVHRSQRQFVLGQMTQEEYDKGELSPERQADIKLKMLETYPAEGTEGIAFKTPEGKAMAWYKSWALPYLERTIQNTILVKRIVQDKGVKAGMKSPEAAQLAKTIPGALLLYLGLSSLVKPEDDDTELTKRLKSKLLDEASSSLQSLDPGTWIGNRGYQFLTDIYDDIKLLLTLEEYKADGKYGKKGDNKGLAYLKKHLTPQMRKQAKYILNLGAGEAYDPTKPRKLP